MLRQRVVWFMPAFINFIYPQQVPILFAVTCPYLSRFTVFSFVLIEGCKNYYLAGRFVAPVEDI